MFGYVTVNKPEIKFKDFDMYRSFYCGLCRELRERYGIPGQISLTYDMTFVVLLLSGLYEPPTQKGTSRCAVHPLKPQPVRRNEITTYCADMNVILSYYKCMDDWQDEKKLWARIFSWMLMPKMKKIPLIGSIACGEPITAEQNIEKMVDVPEYIRCDFSLTCHGDSMSPTICNGDIVCIRCQPEVEQGEIAAVRVGEEATLKHFHRQGDAVMLLADNAAVCPPMFYAGEQLSELHIEGKAVGLCRGL